MVVNSELRRHITNLRHVEVINKNDGCLAYRGAIHTLLQRQDKAALCHMAIGSRFSSQVTDGVVEHMLPLGELSIRCSSQ
jgi:hypothetical protein